MKRAANIALALAFIAVLLAPTVASLLHIEPFKTLDEKRTLAEPPKESIWSRSGLSHASAIAQGWEKYFNDHLGLRKLMIGSYRLLGYKLAGVSPNPSVVPGRSDGKQRWLYFDAGAIHDGIGFESSLGQRPYTPAELQRVAGQLAGINNLVRGTGARLAIAICPDKHTMYPEYLPARLRPAPGAVSRLDQFWDMGRHLTDLPLIDMRPVLKQAKGSVQLYYPSDTHWTWQAGHLAYQKIAETLTAQDPTRPITPVKDLRWTLGPPRVGDLVLLMGIPAFGGDADWLPEIVNVPTKYGKLLVIGDSFSEYIRPLLAAHFDQVKFISASAIIRTLVKPQLLEAEKPDVVLIVSVERYWTML
jgi:alginate O-acetyltransferase complex protein AlgJ